MSLIFIFTSVTSFRVGYLETGMFHIRSSQLHGGIRQLRPYLSSISLKPQQPSFSLCPPAWEHQTIMSVSEQHFPLTSAVIPFSLSSADKGPVCFFKSFHFPLFFISLPNLSLFFSPTLPGSLYLLRANFPPFFFIF